MNIDKLTDQEKSVMLARVIGWRINAHGDMFEIPDTSVDNVGWKWRSNFYSGVDASMEQAWLVLNWAAQRNDGISDYGWPYTVAEGIDEIFRYEDDDDLSLWDKDPADAQRAWLDQILTLTIEAGLVDTTCKEGYIR